MLNGWTTAGLRWWRRLLPVCIGLLGAGLVLIPSRLSESLSRRSYDWSHQLTGVNNPALDASPVVIVYIDRDSYKELRLDETAPWPRELHARLLDRLRQDGARAVVMDILFSLPGADEQSNAELARAIHENGRVVLGEGLNSSTSSMPDLMQSRVLQFESPIAPFRTNAAAVALTTIRMDEDAICRRHFGGIPSQSRRSLAYATADWLGLHPGGDATADRRWMRYYGPPLQIPHVPYYRALDGQTPADYFRDRVVMIGAQPSPGLPYATRDQWESPFLGLGNTDSFFPGVEIHATELLNLMRGDWLTEVPVRAQVAAFLVFGIAGGWLAVRVRPAISVAIILGTAAMGVLLAMGLMSYASLWFAWMIPVLVQAPVSIVGGLTFHTVDWLAARRRAERRIHEQAQLINKAKDAIRLFDPDGRLKLANPRALELFAPWRNGEAPLDFKSEPLANARTILIEKGQWQGEMKLTRPDGRDLVLASSWTRIHDVRGDVSGILIIDTDVTEQKQLEQQLARARRMEVVGAIAGGMAHDLNNSLAPLLMGVQLLKRRHDDQPTRHTLDQMESSARRGAEMVRQVLSFARGRGMEKALLDPGLLINEMTRLARETFPRAIQVIPQVARDVWRVEANATQLHQVLLNLCVNARDAMPDGGTLTLAVDNVALSDEEAAAIPGARPGEFVSIMVNDTGTGIPAEILPRLFEAFFTTKPEGKGTGLGLPTVRRIVENHSGFVQVASAPGAGTCFEVFLPRARESAVPRTQDEPLAERRGDGRTVLVVEDTAAVRELLGESLASLGFRVLATAAPSEALEKVASGHWEPSALVLDVNLPGINALDLLTAFRRQLSGIPAVLAGNHPPDTAAGLPGRCAFLEKPVNVADLVRLLHRLAGDDSPIEPEAGT